MFGRRVVLQIGSAGTVGKSFEGMRVSFDVKMSSTGTPNTATFEAYNLNAATVALAQKSDCVVRLLAGYDVPRQLFQGNPTKDGVRLDRKGVDTVLHIEASDGGKAYKESRLNISFTTSTTMRQVFDAVAEQTGLPLGSVKLPENVTFPHGITLTGPARDVLDRLAATGGSQWYVRDGALQFTAAGDDTGEQAIVFSSDAGNLIGSPSPKDDGISIKALLAPTLRPGKVFQVQSKDYNGFYTASDVEFQGDSGFDTPFYVVATGKPRG